MTPRKPLLTTAQVLRWADEHRQRTGDWPTKFSGRVIGDPARTTWCGVDDALKRGGRGLPGGSSLPMLLAERRGRRHPQMQPPLTFRTILKWVDAHLARTGRWPTMTSGAVRGVPGETWLSIDGSLRFGRRGLAGGSSLPRFLSEKRHRPYREWGGPLSEQQIVQWAKAHHMRTGQWPSRRTPGRVPETTGDTWQNLDCVLREGYRGLPGGTSLLLLLAKRCGMRHRKLPPRLSISQILAWADSHHRRTDRWPTGYSGAVHDADGETWLAIDHALRRGTRGLPGQSSLALLLAEKRDRPHLLNRPPLTIRNILAWADAHYKRSGRWPSTYSRGRVAQAPHEDWNNINAALFLGRRGLPGGLSLARIFTKYRGKFDRFNPSRLTIKKILAWADAHYARTGSWPNHLSGLITNAAGETWNSVYHALQFGRRGLRGRSSIATILAKHRGLRLRRHLPRLTSKQILAWADAHYQRTGEWPSRQSGPIPEAPGETWSTVVMAMQTGSRGLPRRSTLVQLLSAKRASLYRRRGLPLKRSTILDWIAAHHELTGELPNRLSGPVRDQRGETWAAIDASLQAGTRTLRGGESLPELLIRHYSPPYPNCGRPLTINRIIAWAESFKQRVGRWPTHRSAYTDPSRTEKWSTIDIALREGLRGLPGGSSLAKLLRDHARNRTARRPSQVS